MRPKGELERQVAAVVHRLPPLPENIDRLLQQPPTSPEAVQYLVDLISADPSLSVEFLHLANACGAHSAAIETVAEAVADIGVEPLVQLVGASYVSGSMVQHFAALAHLEEYFQHAREIARSTRLLADLADLSPHQREMYGLGGLIHDLGRLVIMVAAGEASAPLMGTTWDQMAAIVHSENELLGMNHCEVGRDVIGKWNLSPVLQEGVLRHHTPLLSDDFSIPGALIFLAHFVATSDFTGEILAGMLPPPLFARLGLSPAAIDHARQRFRALA